MLLVHYNGRDREDAVCYLLVYLGLKDRILRVSGLDVVVFAWRGLGARAATDRGHVILQQHK